MTRIVEVRSILEIDRELRTLVIESDEKKVWLTATNERVPYEKMTDKHLKNSLRFLERKGLLELYQNLLREALRRGIETF